jgi:all-trans-retinol 13,14-reductase
VSRDFGDAGKGFRSDSRAEGPWSHGGTPAAAPKSQGVVDFDAIVVGSGAGGLAAAVALARAGERVCVLEQHDRPGGWTHSFTLGGHTFSPGVHYVGDLGPGGKLRAVYEGLGISNDLEWLELDPDGFDRVRCKDGFAFDIPKGKERFADRLAAAFPAQAVPARRVLDVVASLDRDLKTAAKTKGLVDAATLPLRAPSLIRHGLGSFAALLDRCGATDPYLRAVLSAQGGDHGLPASRAPAALHAGVMGHYFDGGWYPRGGGFAIPRAFVRALKRAGGVLRLQTPAARLLVERGRGVRARLSGRRRVVGVRLASGEELRAKRVISNADPGVTFGRLVDPEHLSSGLRRRVTNLRWSVSAVSLFLAVDMDLRAAGLTSGNVWWSRTPDLESLYAAAAEGTDPTRLLASPVPGLFLTVTTLKDPTKKGKDGQHTVEAFALVPWGLFEPWASSRSGARPADYEALKRRLEGWLLAGLAEVVPGIEKRVTYSSLGTPLTNEHYVASTRGGLYGIEKTLGQLGPLAFGPTCELDGLLLCGASTLSHGVSGATQSGVAAARTALGCRTRDLLREGQPALRCYQAEDPTTWPDDLRTALERREPERPEDEDREAAIPTRG